MGARARAWQRGTTLLEAMIAMAVITLGSVGVMTVHKVGVQLNGDARRTTRGAAIAQDLLDNIALWDFADPRLANGTHGELDLTLGGAVWTGLSSAELLEGPYTRSWSVTRVDDLDGDGVFDAARITVTITLPSGTTLKMYTIKRNPMEN